MGSMLTIQCGKLVIRRCSARYGGHNDVAAFTFTKGGRRKCTDVIGSTAKDKWPARLCRPFCIFSFSSHPTDEVTLYLRGRLLNTVHPHLVVQRAFTCVQALRHLTA